jgi:putative ABC transport system ATP-binding protein
MTLLALRDVSKSYWRGRYEVRVLDGVSLGVEAGEFVAVRAAAREGKTTLLRIAAGLTAPDAGAVFFEGRDLAGAKRRRWWPRAARPVRVEGLEPRMGWVRRSGPSNKSMPMLRYVALALLDEYHDREAMRRSNAVLRELGVDDLARAIWRELSDSERTLMAIAHAVARRPLLLLADDVTGGLGADERETVLAVLRLRVEHSGMAVLMSAESVPATLRAHRIVTLSDGKLVHPTTPPPAEVIPLPRRDSA